MRFQAGDHGDRSRAGPGSGARRGSRAITHRPVLAVRPFETLESRVLLSVAAVTSLDSPAVSLVPIITASPMLVHVLPTNRGRAAAIPDLLPRTRRAGHDGFGVGPSGDRRDGDGAGQYGHTSRPDAELDLVESDVRQSRPGFGGTGRLRGRVGPELYIGAGRDISLRGRRRRRHRDVAGAPPGAHSAGMADECRVWRSAHPEHRRRSRFEARGSQRIAGQRPWLDDDRDPGRSADS